MKPEIFRIDEGKAETTPTPANFTGTVRMQRLSDEGGSQDFEIYVVYFEAGSRTRPHTHPGEQLLIFVRSNGFVHIWGEDLQHVSEGGIVVVPAGVLHMHGALDDEQMWHIATRARNGPTDWDPEVPPEWQQYAKAK
jgi:quercetin dioxygenase-like cupin family protein